MSMASEFREFILRGSVVDMAVGIIMGAAFKDVVQSLVDNVIMPPIGWLIGGVNFSKLKLVLKAANPDGTGGVVISYGAFINSLITLVIVGFVVFMLIKAINKLHRAKPEEPAKPAEDVALLTEIRDLLKHQPR